MEKFINEKVIIRGNRSGVFYGTLIAKDGNEVELKNCRRLWYWDGANSISEIAVNGVKVPERCKFTVVVESIVITDVIEILKCTESAIDSIESVEIWTY